MSAPEFRAKAISLVLAGGIAGGFLGPQASLWGKDLLPVPFLGSFLVMSAIALFALGVQSRVRVPRPSVDESHGGRPLREIARQPVFIVAALSAALGYGIMNLLMTATPLAMSFCSHPFSAAAFVIEWHVVGMYAPGVLHRHVHQAIRRAQGDRRRHPADGSVRCGRPVGRCAVAILGCAASSRRRLELHVHRAARPC